MTWRSGTSYGRCPAHFVGASDVKKAHFIEQALQNRTRADANRTGVVFYFLDYRAPVGVIRDKLNACVGRSKFWNGNAVSVQVANGATPLARRATAAP